MTDLPIPHFNLPSLKVLGPAQVQNHLQQNLPQTSQAVTPPQHATSTPAFEAGTTHTGTVIVQSHSGRHTLQFSDGKTLDVIASRNLPLGARITIQISETGQPQITAMTIPDATQNQHALAKLSGHWPALQDAIKDLKHNAPSAAENLISRLPNLSGKNFLPALLNFAKAIGNDDITKILDRSILSILGSISTEMSDDIAAMRQLMHRESAIDGWRSMIFPYIENDPENPSQGGFYWRNQQDENGKNHTRFVINLQLQSTGLTQIDGLMSNKAMHLKVRLHHLPQHIDFEEFKTGLEIITVNALQEADLSGSIALEITEFFNTDPLHDLLKPKVQFNVEA